MALDVDLFNKAELGTIGARIYSWDGPWVSLGVSQSPERALLTDKVPWVSRPTGGKAVLHGHDVTIGLAATFGSLGLQGQLRPSVNQVYALVVPILARSLAACGLEVSVGSQGHDLNHIGPVVDCFAHVAPVDMVLTGSSQKVCGCALKLGKKSVLVQASVPASSPLVDPALVFRRPAPIFWVKLDPGEFAEALDCELRKLQIP
ncbi:MAG: hypothetical protein JNM34_01205 [Chthonomonadaceae bacterium]|nr:hypothetical protein [Chthonomonadaceae bacterium]